MKHYKDADEILRRLPDDLPYKASVKRVLMQAPDADVVEVRHGEWKQQLRPYEDEIVCTVCGASFNVIDNCTETFDYCPHCGAKMDEERREQ